MLLTSRSNPCFLSPSVLQQSYFCRETDFRFTQSSSQGFYLLVNVVPVSGREPRREERKQTENKNQLPLNEEHSVLLRARPPCLSGLGVSPHVPRRRSHDAGSSWPYQHLSPCQNVARSNRDHCSPSRGKSVVRAERCRRPATGSQNQNQKAIVMNTRLLLGR